MCGILGIVDFSEGNQWQKAEFERVLDKQAHRGPDDRGVSESPYYLLGHRRLSILDLDLRSSQPMYTQERDGVIVFNGEIYNFRELREGLSSKGVSFKTEGDTEVLLKGLMLEGIDFVHKCIGMFAFSFVNNKTKECFIVRDRLGIKPLYYKLEGNRCFFSSVQTSIPGLEGVGVVSTESLSSYLSFRYPVGERSFFKNVMSLPAGCYLYITPDQSQLIQYWDPADKVLEQSVDRGEEYYLEKLHEILDSSIKYRMIADVPVGVYLSGGVDSSALAAKMALLSENNINTFTIGYEQEGFNEFSYADEVAERYKTNHHKIIQSPDDYLAMMHELIQLKGAPLSVPNEVPIWALSKELKKIVTVVLSGEGADELFMGYGRIFRSAYDYERLQGEYAWGSEGNRAAFKSAIQGKYHRSSFDSEVDHFLTNYSYTSFELKQSLLSQDLPLVDYENSFSSEFGAQFDRLDGAAYENKLSYVFIKSHLPGLLNRLDSATMAASVEGRVPFVDHRLVEFVLTIPIKYKLKWLEGANRSEYESLLASEISERYDRPKYLLKKGFEKYLSDRILYRKKVGFPVPLHHWFAGKFRQVASDVLLSQRARNRGLYNTRQLEKILNASEVESDHGLAMKIWMLVNYELFAESNSFKG